MTSTGNVSFGTYFRDYGNIFRGKKRERASSPVLTQAIDEIAKNGKKLPQEDIFEKHDRSDFANSIYIPKKYPKGKHNYVMTDPKNDFILTKKIQLEDGSAVKIGIDRKIITNNGYSEPMKASNAYIQLLDDKDNIIAGDGSKERQGNDLVYYATPDGSDWKYLVWGPSMPEYPHYAKKLIKAADKLCPKDE